MVVSAVHFVQNLFLSVFEADRVDAVWTSMIILLEFRVCYSVVTELLTELVSVLTDVGVNLA